MRPIDYGIPMDQLIHRRVYKLYSRNLVVGVWNEDVKGFAGIREKFGDRFIFTEYHWDNGAPNGTAHGIEDLGIDVPEDVQLKDILELECQVCHQEVRQLWEPDDSYYSGKKCIGDEHIEPTDCDPGRSHFGQWRSNKALFELLDPLDQKLTAEHAK